MKGRVQLDKVNKAIDEIQSIIEYKYKILATPMSKLSGEPLKKYKVSFLLNLQMDNTKIFTELLIDLER